jgi:alkylation response protein AidB-like acyl-CoA dehydrogenase
VAPAELLEGYAQLGGACLTICFILSQREAAVSRIRAHGSPEVQRALLPALARGEQFTTVGLSQLTTSRQHGKPALAVQEVGDRLVLDGVMPWVTGAPQADYFITGGVLPDGRQILVVMHRDLNGVRVPPPLDLMALQGSLTGEVVCENVAVERRWLLAGPVERVLATGSGGAGGLMTSCLALGLIGAATSYLLQAAAHRPELKSIADRQEETRQTLWNELLELSRGGTPERMIDLRGKANTLVLQATQTALTASKGTGFLRNHPAQRWARQALFFLVWSCPRPATEATLAYLTPAGEHDHVCL